MPQQRQNPDRRLPAISPTRCTGCGRCVAACPPHVLGLTTEHWKKRATLDDAENCTGCSLCERHCPFDAIEMRQAAPAEQAARDAT